MRTLKRTAALLAYAAVCDVEHEPARGRARVNCDEL